LSADQENQVRHTLSPFRFFPSRHIFGLRFPTLVG